MWSALAHTYKAMSRWQDAAECYKRASMLSGDGDFWALHELAVIYRDKITPRDEDTTAKFFQQAVDLASEEGTNVESEYTLEACVFLAGYYAVN